jgi:transposase-like protein
MKIRKQLLPYVNHGVLSKEVESDEAWMGKKDNQEIILGMVERYKRRLILKSIANVKEKTLYPIIEEHVERGSTFYTDLRISYAITSIYYHHKTTNHSKGEFGDGNGNHTNTIEQIWGDIKGIIRTIHHGISKKYRALYLAQYIFRYEHKFNSNLFANFLFRLFHPTYCVI